MRIEKDIFPQRVSVTPMSGAARISHIEKSKPQNNNRTNNIQIYITTDDISSLTLDEKRVDLSVKVAKKIKEDFEYSEKIKEDLETTLKILRDVFKTANQNINLADEELNKKVMGILCAKKDLSTLPNKEIWEKANSLRKKLTELKIQPGVDFIEFETFKQIVSEKVIAISENNPSIDIKLSVDEELISLTAYNALKTRGGCFKRFPYHFFEKDKNLDVKVKALVKYFLKEAGTGNNFPPNENGWTRALEKAGLGKIFKFYQLNKLLLLVFPPKDNHTFKETFAKCLSENGLGKFLNKKGVEQYVFTKSMFEEWYEKSSRDNWKNLIEKIRSHDLEPQFKEFANSNIDTALMILFGEKIQPADVQDKKSVMNSIKGDVFVFMVKGNNPEQQNNSFWANPAGIFRHPDILKMKNMNSA